MPTPPDTRVQELHLTLRPAPKPVAKYRTALLLGDLLYVSGHGPLQRDGSLIKGRVGVVLRREHGQAASRQSGLSMASTARTPLGSLHTVERLVKKLGL